MDNLLEELKIAIAEDERKGLNELTGDSETDKRLITDDSKANFFCKIIKQNQEEIDKINSFVDDELEQIRIRYDNYRNEKIDSLQSQIDYFTSLLESYTYNQLENKKAKSIKLPYGTLQIRKQQPVIEYDDSSLEWLKENKPEYINVKISESIDKKKIKKDCYVNSDDVLYIDEEKVPGVSIIHKPDKFEIK